MTISGSGLDHSFCVLSWGLWEMRTLSPARSLCWRSWGQCAWCLEDTGRCWRPCCTTRGLLQREPVFRYVDTHLQSWNKHTSVPFLECLKLSTILSVSRRPIYIGCIIVAHILILAFEDEMNWHVGSFSCVGDMMRVSMTACPPKVAQRCVWQTAGSCVHLWTKWGDKQAADASRKDSSWPRGGNLQNYQN